MKLNLNAKETVELFAYLSAIETNNTQINEVKNRLKSYIVKILNDIDKVDLDKWEKSIAEKLKGPTVITEDNQLETQEKGD